MLNRRKFLRGLSAVAEALDWTERHAGKGIRSGETKTVSARACVSTLRLDLTAETF